MYKLVTRFILVVIFGLCNAANDFIKAAAFVRGSKPVRMSNSTKLKVYALFKQATVGDCPSSGSGVSDPYRRATMNAWYDVRGMKREDAETEYVKMIDQLSPGWRNL